MILAEFLSKMSDNGSYLALIQFEQGEKCIIPSKYIQNSGEVADYKIVRSKYSLYSRVTVQGDFVTLANKVKKDIDPLNPTYLDDEDEYHLGILLRSDKTLELLKTRINNPRSRIKTFKEADLKDLIDDFKHQESQGKGELIKNQKTVTVSK